jgi:hypothetical protein
MAFESSTVNPEASSSLDSKPDHSREAEAGSVGGRGGGEGPVPVPEV